MQESERNSVQERNFSEKDYFFKLGFVLEVLCCFDIKYIAKTNW